jgi:predicted DNA-binding protein
MAQTQVRLPDVLMDRISAAAERTGMSKNDIIKHTVDAGLKYNNESTLK